jgi:citrate synthase
MDTDTPGTPDARRHQPPLAAARAVPPGAAGPPAPDPAPVVPGLRGVVAAETAVGDVRGDEGFYHYRQYSAVDLAGHASLEDVWFLILEGHLPAPAERAAFAAEVAAARSLPAPVTAQLPAIARACRRPLDAYRTALSLLAAHDGPRRGSPFPVGRPLMDLSPAERRAAAVRLVAVTPVLLAALHRLGRPGGDPGAGGGSGPVPWPPGQRWAAAYLQALTGAEAAPAHARAVERYLISTIDHGFNASTFTARVVASTGADLASAVLAGVGALSGPRHGGAPSRALDLLDEIAAVAGGPDVSRTGGRDRTVAAVDRVVGSRLAAGERIMGFGHAVYRTEDPRARLLRQVALDLGGPLAGQAVVVEQRVLELLAEHRPDRALSANVELYAGVVMAACGIPRSMFTPTFASSRVIGWCAHALEQVADGTIIRPLARYTGPPAPQPLPGGGPVAMSA